MRLTLSNNSLMVPTVSLYSSNHSDAKAPAVSVISHLFSMYSYLRPRVSGTRGARGTVDRFVSLYSEYTYDLYMILKWAIANSHDSASLSITFVNREIALSRSKYSTKIQTSDQTKCGCVL